MLNRWFLVVILLGLQACATQKLMRQDYDASISALILDEPQTALLHYPKGERDSFIVTMEKTYLNLLAGHADLTGLQRYADEIEDRVRYDVSREIAAYFYVETSDGYYASEHEIIWLHMLLSWGYSLQQQYEKACVESRKSAFLLSYEWSHEGHFDDAMLRVLLGALWAMCGSWDDAVVDFRKAYRLDPNLAWLKPLAERQQAPRHLFVGLGGIGPELYWDPTIELNPIRGIKHLGFQLTAQQSDLTVQSSQQQVIPLYLSPTAAPWYERHWVRNNIIHDLIDDSQYSTKVLLSGGLSTAKTATGIAWGVVAGALITAGGAVIVRYANDADDILAGIGLMLYGPKYAVDSIGRTTKESIDDVKEELDISEQYRFVRFLPEYAWLGWSDEVLTPPLHVVRSEQTIKSLDESLSHRPDVSLFHYADVNIDERQLALSLTSDKHAYWLSALQYDLKHGGLSPLIKKQHWQLDQRKSYLLAEGYHQGRQYRLYIYRDRVELVLKRGLFNLDEVLVLNSSATKTQSLSRHAEIMLNIKPVEVIDLIKTLSAKLN